jgi:dTDP-4-amino-4,6-dideoxygalactose transaminase
VITNSVDIAGRVEKLRNYGGNVKYHHPETGFNSRLDTLQAVVLLAKLQHLTRWNEERREAARRYTELLRDVPDLVCPSTMPGNVHTWHLYVVRAPRRNDVLQRLQSAGIGAAIHYPIPCHLQGAFSYLGHRAGAFPVAERASEEVLSLPLFPGITIDQQERVALSLRSALRHA